jgi:2-methylcitrate dehydratase PrpD
MTNSATVLADFLCQADANSISSGARIHGRRAFLNWLGCALGACSHPSVDAILNSLRDMRLSSDTVVIGRGRHADIQHAALINASSSSIYAFDDTHRDTVTHPTGPVAAALMAYAEHHSVSGRDFLAALVLGIEIECRLSNALSRSPAEYNVGWYLTGVTGAAGAAAALGKVMGLDRKALVYALGLGALQGAGFRQAHGSMCMGFVPGHAARAGVLAAFMARNGFTCADTVFEGKNGFFDVFGQRPLRDELTKDLGRSFEIELNLCKPYPAGIFIHPAIDACLQVRRENGLEPDQIDAVTLVVHPLGIGLTGRNAPVDSNEALVSIYHWAAVTLLTGRAGIAEVTDECVRSAGVVAMRDKITAIAEPGIARDEAHIEVLLGDGRVVRAHVAHARGGPDRQLGDDEVAAKFLVQANSVLPSGQASRLKSLCFDIEEIADMRIIPELLYANIDADVIAANAAKMGGRR